MFPSDACSLTIDKLNQHDLLHTLGRNRAVTTLWKVARVPTLLDKHYIKINNLNKRESEIKKLVENYCNICYRISTFEEIFKIEETTKYNVGVCHNCCGDWPILLFKCGRKTGSFPSSLRPPPRDIPRPTDPPAPFPFPFPVCSRNEAIF